MIGHLYLYEMKKSELGDGFYTRLMNKRHSHITMRFKTTKNKKQISKKSSIDAIALDPPQMLLLLSPDYDNFVWMHFANFDSHKSSVEWENGELGCDVGVVRNGEKNDAWTEVNDAKNAAHVADCISDLYFEVNFDEN